MKIKEILEEQRKELLKNNIEEASLIAKIDNSIEQEIYIEKIIAICIK